MIEFNLAQESGVSIYRQIIQQIKSGIMADRIRPGEQLPSVREMSSQLKINPLTVAKAYLELEHERLVATRWGKGTFVSERIPQLDKEEAEAQLDKLIDCFITEAMPLAKKPNALLRLVQKKLKNF